MTFAEGERAAKVSIESTNSCGAFLLPGPGSGFEPFTKPSPILGPPGVQYMGFMIWDLDFPTGSIDEIDIQNPAIYTISGVHVGSTYDDVIRTYPNAVAHDYSATNEPPGTHVTLTITNPEGHVIIFGFGPERVVMGMTLGASEQALINHSKC